MNMTTLELYISLGYVWITYGTTYWTNVTGEYVRLGSVGQECEIEDYLCSEEFLGA